MLKQPSSEQFWKLYEKLPQELKDTLWAQETGDQIYEICQRYDAAEHLTEVSLLVGQIFVGLVLPSEFQKELEKLDIGRENAQMIAREINRFVFYPVKPALEQLHDMEIGKTAEQKPEQKVEEQKTEKRPISEDTYKEPIE